VASTRPVVVVLDDLHAADEPSALLLEFVAAELQRAPMLVVACYRHQDLAGNPGVAGVLGRLTMAQRVVLRGLSRDEVGDFVASVTGFDPSDRLVASVHGMTEGNPFFVQELVRLLASEGRLDDEGAHPTTPVPQGVRELIGRRLGRLDADAAQELRVASVIGREFDVPLLERVHGGDPPAVLGHLEAAAEAGLVARAPGPVQRFAFPHALVRETLYEELATIERVRLHRLVAEAIEDLHGPDLDEHLAQLAHHYLEGAADGTGKQAVRYARLAADQAAERLAFEEAVRLLDAALRVADITGAPASTRAEVLLALGRAQWRSGDERAAADSFGRAAQAARRAEAPALLAEAALGPGDVVVMLGLAIGYADWEQVHMLEEAAEGLGADQPALRARVLARLASHLYWSDPEDRWERLSAEALELAREAGDPATLAYALTARHWVGWGPDNLEERLATAREIVRIAERLEDGRLEAMGRIFLLLDLLEKGDVAVADQEAATIQRISEEMRDPTGGWFATMYRAGRAIREGRFEDAEAMATEAYGQGTVALPGDPSWPTLSMALQTYQIRFAQGRIAELEPMARALVQDLPGHLAAWRCALACVLAELGREEEARAQLDPLVASGFAELPRDVTWLSALTQCAHVASVVDDAAAAEVLYGLLEPYPDRHVLIGPGAALGGPVSLFLGMLATTTGQFDRAEKHFEHAAGEARRIGSGPWVAQARYRHAAMLLRRDDPGDRERAAGLARDALEAAGKLGMAKVAADAERLVGAVRGVAEAAAVIDEVPATATFRRQGEYWTLAFAGPVFRLRDSKGLRYLAELLQRPGVELHVLDLAAAANPGLAAKAPAGSEGLDGGPGDAGEILDATARGQYRRRVEELRDEIDEAERFNDPERAARARLEMEAIAAELSAAVGLGGRPRRAGSPAERARVNVRNGISAALRAIRGNDEALWRHLSNAVRTGTFCSYQPEREVAWSL